ncbi:MAG: VCBS repeat-containing protein [Bacteroidetes bacterium]|nr:VCBS repeat-containing protein [Bacteroidota bacterium]
MVNGNLTYLLLFMAVTLFSSAQNKQASEVQFDGKTGYVEVPYDSLLNPSETFTYELWARVDSFSGDYRAPFSMRDMLVGVVFYASNSNYWEVWLGTGTAWSPTIGPRVRLGEWTHLAVVYDQHHVKFYVNGLLYGDVFKNYALNRRRPLRFGVAADGFRYYFPGAVSDVRIWNTARTQEDLIRSMNGEAREDESGILGHWDFSGNGGSVENSARKGRFEGILYGRAVKQRSSRPIDFPLLQTDRNIIEFPETNVGVNRVDTLRIINHGRKMLSGTVSFVGQNDIVVDSGAFSLTPGMQHAVPVAFYPKLDGKKNGTIIIRHNGPGALREIPVQGRCRVPRIDSTVFDRTNNRLVIHGEYFDALIPPQVFYGNLRAPIREFNGRMITLSAPPGTPYAPLNVTTFLMTAAVPKPVSIPSAVQGSITSSSFSRSISLPFSENQKKIHLSDLDGNGKSDLIVPESLSVAIYHDVELLSGSSDGMKRSSIPLVSQPTLLLDDDYDSDGKTDLLVISAQARTMSLYRNTSSSGRMIFVLDQTIPIEADPVIVSAGDLDNDLKKDVVLICGISRMFYLYRNISGYNQCRFRFEGKDNVQKNPSKVVISDLDGDGKNDLIVTGDFENSINIFQNFSLSGRFILEPQIIVPPAGRISDCAVFDVNGDGKDEVITLNKDVNTFTVYENISEKHIRLGRRFDFSTGNAPAGMTLGDLNGDGRPEIIITNENSRTVSLYRNSISSGALTQSSFTHETDIPIDIAPGIVSLSDLDFDGKPEILAADAKHRIIAVLKNDVQPDSAWFWIWLSLAGIGALGAVILGIRYTELKRIRRQISELEEQQRLQEEFAKKMIESQENERSRIAQELHDGLGQELLIIKNTALLSIMQSESMEKMKEQLHDISAAASKVIKIARDISYNLRPAELDRLGLSETLRSIVVELRKSSTVKVSGEVDMIDGLVPKESEINIVRIIQESTSNAIKHSQADELRISVNIEENSIVIRVIDNGMGMPLRPNDASGNPRGLGLAGIDERVRILKGALQINSEPGKGTSVTVRIPTNTSLPSGQQSS